MTRPILHRPDLCELLAASWANANAPRLAVLRDRYVSAYRRCRGAIAFAALFLASCHSPLQQYAEEQANLTNEQIKIDQMQTAILVRDDRRIDALERVASRKSGGSQ